MANHIKGKPIIQRLQESKNQPALACASRPY